MSPYLFSFYSLLSEIYRGLSCLGPSRQHDYDDLLTMCDKEGRGGGCETIVGCDERASGGRCSSANEQIYLMITFLGGVTHFAETQAQVVDFLSAVIIP